MVGVRGRPAFEARPQVDGKAPAGTTGLEVDPYGHLGPRTCPRCQTRLDDVDGLGVHPWCVPVPPSGGGCGPERATR